MSDVATLRLRLTDLLRLRDERAAQGKLHLVAYIDEVIAETEKELARAERPRPLTPGAT